MIVIGSLIIKNNVILAPMAGISNLPFRMMAREAGCALAFTEMISANGLVRGIEKSQQYMKSCIDDKPLGVQIFGNDPTTMADAVRIVDDYGADLIDLNMGCPVKKVVKNGAGAALLKDPGLVSQILESVRKATRKPLTVKIRSGWNLQSINAVQIARIAEQQGIDAVFVHARTAVQGFAGSADWRIIEEIKNSVGIKVIGNGDVKSGADAWRMIKMTGCDGVMIGRGALGNPWIFNEALNYQSTVQTHSEPVLNERKEMILRHLERETIFLGQKEAVKRFRKHLLWYTKGIRGGASFRSRVTTISDQNLLLREIEAFFDQEEIPYQ
ncbi:tRNA dihydrouridine synthase DusB [Syntrophus aciditrophicus]|uniref:tRNA-dihydrouridine synthase n=1 Tax=Syntrophus aciditrophicus (strain SB) TaxID=56780 RepID=Q2LR94_SYNAS|nr:tRNA dihydrouridine synthase DusB [Syntrophus aciditrophicus]ABC76607.1 tRNA-dihydrouridine synthase [Syntrophus aciditrophicus SB]OPY17219.1 MAG: tRNA-dihydrouridine synthase C [Syntrophus sp. PtaB.Bin075]